MLKRSLIIVLALCSIIYCNCTSQAQPVKTTNVVSLKNRIVTIPAGFVFNAYLMTPINSKTAYNGQEITLALGSDLIYNNQIIASAGSAVYGTVIEASKAKHGALNGKIALRFTHIITPAGLDIPISAVINTTDDSGALIGTKDNTKIINKETLTVSGKTYESMPICTSTLSCMNSTGSGGWLIKSVWDKGEDVNLPVNTQLELILSQPITVNPELLKNE